MSKLWEIAHDGMRENRLLRAEKALLTILNIDEKNAAALSRMEAEFRKQLELNAKPDKKLSLRQARIEALKRATPRQAAKPSDDDQEVTIVVDDTPETDKTAHQRAFYEARLRAKAKAKPDEQHVGGVQPADVQHNPTVLKQMLRASEQSHDKAPGGRS
jgi:glyceraldehyde-3-phosphate dehydrogenase/erythrose-4-phosphate dehydrogenase